MNPGDRVLVLATGLWWSGHVGTVDKVLANGLIGVKFDGIRSVEFFTKKHLERVPSEPEGTAA